VRSSSNAEDLAGFSAPASRVDKPRDTADRIFSSIKEVWASLVSPRQRPAAPAGGISLDDSYMGVIVQSRSTAAAAALW